MERFIDSGAALKENVDGLYIQRFQEIPEDFLTDLHEKRMESAQSRAGEFHLAASIPAVFVDKWLREGFNIFEAPLKDILKKLRTEGLDKFRATEKSL